MPAFRRDKGKGGSDVLPGAAAQYTSLRASHGPQVGTPDIRGSCVRRHRKKCCQTAMKRVNRSLAMGASQNRALRSFMGHVLGLSSV